MKYELILTGKFKKGLKLARKRGLDIKLLADVVEKLQNDVLTLTLVATGSHSDLLDM